MPSYRRSLEYSKEISSPIESATTTYSTSAIANGNTIDETMASLTDDTLSMISTPWSTDSWTVSLAAVSDDFKSSLSSPNTTTSCTLTSITFQPCSSSSYVTSPPAETKSNTTISLLDLYSLPIASRSLHHPTATCSKTHSDTLSSWTLETFTSTGITSDSKAVKPEYPWSPSTVFSDTDIYPSSVDTLESRKVSRETLATATFGSARENTNLLFPMNYIVRTSKEYNPVLEWELVKQRGDPINIG